MANGFKTGGRVIGTPNQITGQLKEIIGAIVVSEIENLPELLESLEPFQRAQLTIKLLQYILPRPEPSREESTLNSINKIEVTIVDNNGNYKNINN